MTKITRKRKGKSVKHKKVVPSWDPVANLRKTQKKKYCKKYYKGKYKIDKPGCKTDPRCLYADMGSGGELCYMFDPFGVGTINETPVKIIISGHSSNPNKHDYDNNYFNVPLNFNIHFYANENETCFVPYDYDSLTTAVGSMNSNTHDIFGPGANVDNYKIEFDAEQGIGIFEYNNDDGGGFKLLSGKNMKNMTLKDIINFLDTKYKGRQIELYAVFCRGSVRETIGNPVEAVYTFNLEDWANSDFSGGKKYKLKSKQKMRKTKKKKTIKPKKRKQLNLKKRKCVKLSRRNQLNLRKRKRVNNI